MTLLYALNVPEDVSKRPSTARSLQLAQNSPLNSDVPEVDTLSAAPGSRPLVGIAAGEYADVTAREFEELFSASGIEVVPFTSPDPTRRDGYYALENIDVQQAQPRETKLQTFEGTLSEAGTPASHYRAVLTNPQTVDNPFGSDAAAEVGVSARAGDVEWWDKVDGSRADATVQRTVSGEHDRINIYDATEPAMDSPVLLHRVPLDIEWQTDVRVWDDRNRSKVARENYDGATVGGADVGGASTGSQDAVASTWQRCFVSGHQFAGRPVLETDRLRLRADLDRQRLVASRWGGAQYDLVQLGSSDWRLADLDIARIGVERIEAQTVWTDTTSSGTHRLDLTLKRGREDALWTVPDNSSSPPSGLVDRLNPIASTAGQDAAEVVDIIANSEVRE